MKGFTISRPGDATPKRPLFIAIYGFPGVGKTSLAMTMPNALLLDFDRGIARATKDVQRPLSVSVQSYEELQDWILSGDFENFVKSEGIESVIIDTVGTLLDDYIAGFVVRSSSKNRTEVGGLSRSGWGILSDRFSKLKSRLQNELNLHILAISHSKEEQEAAVKMQMAVKGGTADIIFRTSDLLGYIYVEGKKRILDFNATDWHLGKNLGSFAAFTIPDSKDDTYPDFFGSLIKTCEKIMGMVETPAKPKIDKELLQEYQLALQTCDTPDEFKALGADIAKLDKIYQEALKKDFAARMKEKNIIFDKASKTYQYEANPTN